MEMAGVNIDVKENEELFRCFHNRLSLFKADNIQKEEDNIQNES